MEELADLGLFAPYRKKPTTAGLSLSGCGGMPIYSVSFPSGYSAASTRCRG